MAAVFFYWNICSRALKRVFLFVRFMRSFLFLYAFLGARIYALLVLIFLYFLFVGIFSEGHGKQGGWHLFSEDSGHGYAISRSSSDKILEEDSRPSISRGDGKYGRSSRENRGAFAQRDWRGHSWEPSNGTMNLPRRPQDVNNDQRAVDDALAYSSHPHSDFGNSWDQHHLKDQHEKIGSVNGMGTGPRSDRENSLGDWKPLKWTRSGSLSSRGSGFSHSSSSRSMGAADSHEARAELQTKSAAANESHSGEAAACATSSVPSEDTASRKKPRLNWGEGLAKYEKKKVEVPEPSANKDGPVLSASITEPCNFLSTSLVDKSPKVTGFSECASPATPSSVACSSSPGMLVDTVCLYFKFCFKDLFLKGLLLAIQ